MCAGITDVLLSYQRAAEAAAERPVPGGTTVGVRGIGDSPLASGAPVPDRSRRATTASAVGGAPVYWGEENIRRPKDGRLMSSR